MGVRERVRTLVVVGVRVGVRGTAIDGSEGMVRGG